MNKHPQHMLDDATLVRPGQAVPNPAAADSLLPPMDAASAGEISAFLGRGRNPLLQAASPLLVLAVQLRHNANGSDADTLRTQVQAQISRFETRMAEAGIAQQTVTAARYVLCAMIDESVLNSPWGERSGWGNRTLLVTLHGESYGGARFFQLLERLLPDVPRHVDLLELMYVCMALGFSGRFQIEAGGRARLTDIQDDLHRRIRAHRGALADTLSPHWRGLETRSDPLVRRLLPWLVAAVAGCVLLGSFAWFHGRLNELAAPIGAEAARVGLGAVAPPGDLPRPVATLTLAQLLSVESRAGLLEVEQRADGQARIRLAAGTMFMSGGDELGDNARALITRVGKALEQLPGRVLVVGHTDDQALRSLRFKDNYGLSTARARAVAAVLSRSLADPARIEVVGAGASQPIAQPASLPENRARNRRVEILFQPAD